MRPEAGPESLHKRASFSKATCRCPARRPGFPGLPAAGANARSRGITGSSSSFVSEDLGSEALRSAAVTMIPAAVVTAILLAVGSTIETAVAPSSAEPSFHTRQDRQPASLALVEGLVKRVRRVRDLLQRRP